MEGSDANLLSNYPWLTIQLFEKIIQKEYTDGQVVHVKSGIAKRALKHGENYASQMIRVVVMYYVNNNESDVQSINFIIKASLVNNDLGEAMAKMNIFEKEINMYLNILPKVEEMLAEIGEKTKLCPRCYDASVENSYLIFEDLTKSNYENTNRRFGMDIDHYKIVLSKIAKFHAVTAFLKTQEYDKLKPHEKCVFIGDSEDVQKFNSNLLKSVAELTKISSDFEQISNKLNNIIDKFSIKVSNAYTNENCFIALAHGDLWCNNIMFSYDKTNLNKPLDAVLVDYQISYIGPAIIDLAYSLFTSSNEDLCDRDWDIILRHYHSVLKNILQKLNYSGTIPTLTDIQIQFLQCAVASSVIGMFVVGIRHYEDADENTNGNFMNDAENDREIRMKILSNPNCRKGLKFLVDYFDRKGFFD